MGQREPAVGVVGLGRMGLPIARRIRDGGVRVLAHDIDASRATDATSHRLEWVKDLGALCSMADVVVSVLPGPDELRSIIATLAGRLHEHAAWIDVTSAPPSLHAEKLRLADPAIRLLECPVGGGPVDAAAGQLLGYLGASARDRADHQWLLDLWCKEIVHVGPPGSGYAAKLIANQLWFAQAVAVAEALALGSHLGLEPRALTALLSKGPAGSRFLEQYAPRLLDGDVVPTFSLGRIVEELNGLLSASNIGLSLPMSQQTAQIYADVLAQVGDLDGELLAARHVAEQLGVTFPVKLNEEL